MSETSPVTPFSFEEPRRARDAAETVTKPGGPIEQLQRVMSADELERIRKAVYSVGEAAYHWVIESDEIFWTGNAADLLQCPVSQVGTGRDFAARRMNF